MRSLRSNVSEVLVKFRLRFDPEVSKVPMRFPRETGKASTRDGLASLARPISSDFITTRMPYQYVFL